jgi:hypothetical protein
MLPAVAGVDVCLFQRFPLATSSEPAPKEKRATTPSTADLTVINQHV